MVNMNHKTWWIWWIWTIHRRGRYGKSLPNIIGTLRKMLTIVGFVRMKTCRQFWFGSSKTKNCWHTQHTIWCSEQHSPSSVTLLLINARLKEMFAVFEWIGHLVFSRCGGALIFFRGLQKCSVKISTICLQIQGGLFFHLSWSERPPWICKSQLCSLFHERTCSRFTRLFVVVCLSPCPKYLIDPYNAIFLKSQGSKDIKLWCAKGGDAPYVVMHHRWWCTTGIPVTRVSDVV